jgi:SSS family solute:Na+ symporter
MILSWLDCAIIVGYVLACALIGLIVKRYVHSVSDFAVAGRSVGVNMGVAGMTCCGTGMVAMMYTAEMGFHYGFAGAVPGVIAGLASLLVGTTGFMVGPLRRAKVITVPEMLERRFGKRVRWLAGVVVALGGLLNMGIFLRLGGEFLIHITGLDPSYLKVTMVALLAIAVLYTMVGGMVAVVLTNYFQFLVLGVGMLIISSLVIWQTPWPELTRQLRAAHDCGIEYRQRQALEHDTGQKNDASLRHNARQLAAQYVLVDTSADTPKALTMGNPVNPAAQEGVGVAWLVWQILFGISAAVTWQTGVSRALSSKDVATGKRIFRLNTFHPISAFVLPALWAIGAYLFFCRNGGLPEGIGALTATPEYLARLLPMGVIGVVVAGMLAAEMSTDSSYMLAWATVIYNDLIAPCMRRQYSESMRLLMIRLIVLLIGVFLVFYGLLYELSGTAFDYIIVTGTIYVASMFALLMGAIYMPWINTAGAYASILLGAVGPLTFVIVNAVADASHRIAPATAGLSAYAMAFGGLIVGSLVGHTFGQKSATAAEMPEAAGEHD